MPDIQPLDIVSFSSSFTPFKSGWDDLLDTEIATLIGQFRDGMLQRTEDLVVPSSDPGAVILEVPPGYRAIVDHILIRKRGSIESGDLIRIGTQSSSPDNWNNAAANVFANFGAGEFVQLSPRPKMNLSGETKAYATRPLLDGDGTNNRLRIRNVGTALTEGHDFSVYGVVWAKGLGAAGS